MAKQDYDDDVVVYDAVPVTGIREAERDETEAERKTREFFHSLNGGDKQGTGTVSIYRVVDGGSIDGEGFCDRMPADKFGDPETLYIYIRNKFGPGQYRIVGRENGKRGIRMNTLVEITPTVGSTPNLPAVISPGARGNSDTMAMMAMLQQQHRDLLAALQTRDKSIDLTWLKDPAVLALLIPAATTVVSALLERRRDPLADLTQLLTITGTIKELRDDGDSDKGADTWPGLIAGALDKFAGVLPALAAPRSAPAGPAGQQSAPTLPPVAQALAPHLAQLIQLADQGAEPERCAQMVLGAVPDQYRAPLLEFLAADNAVSQLARVNPAVIDRAVWFDELRYCVLELANPEPADTATDDDSAAP